MTTLLPSLTQARASAKRIACSSNLRQIGLAENSYANDYSDYFTQSKTYRTSLKEDSSDIGTVYHWNGILIKCGYFKAGQPSNGVFSCPSRAMEEKPSYPSALEGLLCYSMNRYIIGSIDDSVSPSTIYTPAIRRNSIKRPSECILAADATQVGDYYWASSSVFCQYPWATNAEPSWSGLSNLLNPALQLNQDGDSANVYAGYMRYRHSNSAMSLMPEGHVQSLRFGCMTVGQMRATF